MSTNLNSFDRTRSVLAMFFISMMVVGCKQGMIVPDDFTRVTEQEVGDYIGKKLELNGNHITLSDNGTFAGQWNGGPIAGDWEMRDDYWCRVLTEFYQPERLNQEDCQLWEASGTMLRGTRSKGTGQSFVYTVK